MRLQSRTKGTETELEFQSVRPHSTLLLYENWTVRSCVIDMCPSRQKNASLQRTNEPPLDCLAAGQEKGKLKGPAPSYLVPSSKAVSKRCPRAVLAWRSLFFSTMYVRLRNSEVTSHNFSFAPSVNKHDVDLVATGRIPEFWYTNASRRQLF